MDSRMVATEFRMAQWAQVLQDRRESGESVKDYCQTRGIDRNRYFYWQRKLRDAACGQLAAACADAGQQSRAMVGFAEVRLQPSPWTGNEAGPGTQGSLVAEVSGVRISADGAYPAEKLAHLLRGLVGRC